MTILFPSGLCWHRAAAFPGKRGQRCAAGICSRGCWLLHQSPVAISGLCHQPLRSAGYRHVRLHLHVRVWECRHGPPTPWIPAACHSGGRQPARGEAACKTGGSCGWDSQNQIQDRINRVIRQLKIPPVRLSSALLANGNWHSTWVSGCSGLRLDDQTLGSRRRSPGHFGWEVNIDLDRTVITWSHTINVSPSHSVFQGESVPTPPSDHSREHAAEHPHVLCGSSN